MNVHRSPHLRARIRHDSRGFTLIEVLIAMVLSAMIAGRCRRRSGHCAERLQVHDRPGRRLERRRVDLVVPRPRRTIGRRHRPDDCAARRQSRRLDATHPTRTAIACSPSPAAVMVRFSWVDRTSMSAQTRVVVTYALDQQATHPPNLCDEQLHRSTSCSEATSSRRWRRANRWRRSVDCGGHPTSISMDLEGKGTGAPLDYTLTASLRSAPSLLTIIRPTELDEGRRLGAPMRRRSCTTIGASTLTTWTATGLPTGLSIDPSSGMICGTPNPVGTFPVTSNRDTHRHRRVVRDGGDEAVPDHHSCAARGR